MWFWTLNSELYVLGGHYVTSSTHLIGMMINHSYILFNDIYFCTHHHLQAGFSSRVIAQCDTLISALAILGFLRSSTCPEAPSKEPWILLCLESTLCLCLQGSLLHGRFFSNTIKTKTTCVLPHPHPAHNPHLPLALHVNLQH